MSDREEDAAAERGPARASSRDSLFLLTVLCAPDGRDLGSARVRNLSAHGLMADCESPRSPGDRISMTLRGVGNVEGEVAWAQGNRIGVRFDTPIDPQLARRPVAEVNRLDLMPAYLRHIAPITRVRR